MLRQDAYISEPKRVTGFECGDIVHTYYDDAAQMRDHYIEHGGSAAVQGQSQPSSC